MSWPLEMGGPALLVALLLLALTLAAVWGRGRRQVLGSAIAALALAALWIAPRPVPSYDSTVLLTDGADLTRLSDEGFPLDPSRPAFAIGGQPRTEPSGPWPRWVTRLADPGALARDERPLGTLVVAGHGLEPWDTARLDGVRLARAAVPEPPRGVRWIEWRRDLGAGSPLRVTGALSLDGALSEGADGAVLRLVGVDRSAAQPLRAVEGVDRIDVDLRILPPGPGRFLYQLVVETGEAPVVLGQVDVSVRSSVPPAVLWLERAPSFETRYVKQWLIGLDGPMALRSRMSRDRLRYEFHNMDRRDLSRLTRDRLESFDVVVVDPATWGSLAPSERAAVEGLVSEGRLGLLLRLEPGIAGTSEAPFGIVPRRIEGLEVLMVRPAEIRDTPDPIAIAPFELTDAGIPLFQDTQGRVLAAQRPFGRGSVAFTTMTDSFRWVLEGRADVHRAYWLSLFESVAPTTGEARWLPPGGPVIAGEPLQVLLAAGLADPTAAIVEPSGERRMLPLRQHPTRPDRFTASIWPRTSGWYQLVAEGAEASFWVAPATDWESWRLQRRRDATELALVAANTSVDRSPPVGLPWARLGAFAVLLGALGLLWVNERSSS